MQYFKRRSTAAFLFLPTAPMIAALGVHWPGAMATPNDSWSKALRRLESVHAKTSISSTATTSSAGATSSLGPAPRFEIEDLPGLGGRELARSLFAGKLPEVWKKNIHAILEGGKELKLQWPVKAGNFVRGFGSGTGGYHLAVDISAPTGRAIHAVEDAVVAYVGRALRGFGKVALLVHRDGSSTLYAHAKSFGIQAGDKVSRGETIGKVGSTGISRGPHLHFEFMRDGKNCDPLPLFAQAPPSSEKQRAKVERLFSRDKKDLRCKPRMFHPHGRNAHHNHS